MCMLSHGVAWPINFKLLLLTLHASPRLALTSADTSLRRFHLKVWSISEGKNAKQALPTCSGGKSRKGAGRRGQAQLQRGQSVRARPVFCTKKQFCKLSLIAQRCWQHVSAVENQERLRSC